MQNTANLNLKKPEGTDIVNIEDLNGNMDILDAEIVKKVDKVTGKQLSTEDYTTDEKTKLAGVAANANNYTHPASHSPSIITQDANNRFATDAEKTAWNAKASTAVATTSANGLMSSTDKTKLDGVAAKANKYTHPASHPPSIITQDASNRFATDAEKATWNAKASTAVATTSASGLMSSADKTKLDGVAVNANNYTHPASHAPSIITQDASNRFVTDTEKATWNAKAGTAVATTSANGLMSSTDKTKLDGVAANANNYTHPASHPPSIITQDASNRFVTDDEKTAWNEKETPEGAQAKADAVQVNLAAHTDATNPHASTYTATANRIILRDANGRAQVAAPSAAADIARKDTVDTVQTNLNTHAADRLNHIPYAVATGTANTYAVTLSPAPTAYADGMAVCVKINVASTGASTVNVNGLGAKTILDSLGNAITAGGLKAATPYTLRYNGTNFIVQGKGGGGNAAAGDLLSGKTATVDGGPIVGTMPVIAGDTTGTAVSSVAGSIYIRPPQNSYWPSTGYFVYYDDPDFNPANFLATKNIFGLQGAIPVLGNEEYWSWRRATVVAPSQESRVNLAIPIGAYLTENVAQGAGLTGIFAEDPDFIAANFLATKNIFGLQGAIPVRTNTDTGGSYPQSAADSCYDGQVYIMPPAGYYNGGVWVLRSIPNLVASNIRQGVQIGTGTGGVITGTLVPGKKYATGAISINSQTSESQATISGLTFVPKLIVFASRRYVSSTDWNNVVTVVYHSDYFPSPAGAQAYNYYSLEAGNNWQNVPSSTSGQFKEPTVTTNGATVTLRHFYGFSGNITWWAFGD